MTFQAIFLMQTFSLHPILYPVNTLDHYANMPMQYIPVFHYFVYNKLQYFTAVKNDNFLLKNCDIFLIFAQNIDYGYTLEPPEAVLTSTHNLCFRAKIRKNVWQGRAGCTFH